MLTLTQINQEVRRRLPRKPRIHDRTVARTLDGMLFRFKISRRQPAERNRPDVIQKRHDYANWFTGQAIVSHTVFVDECGNNIWTARIKSCHKSRHKPPEIQREMNNRDEARRQDIPLGHYRTQLLMEALQRNAGTIAVAKCTQWFRFMQTYLPRCINRKVIEQVKRHRLD